MRASSLVALCVAATGCAQILGIDPSPLDDVPAIAGGYVAAVDFRTNSTLNEVVLFNAVVTYDRDDHHASIIFQPALSNRADVGDSWFFEVEVNTGSSPMYAGSSVQGTVPMAASAHGLQYTIEGTVAGVFKDETSFCGVLTGAYTLAGSTAALPSVTFGAIKYLEPSSPVSVNCSDDRFTP